MTAADDPSEGEHGSVAPPLSAPPSAEFVQEFTRAQRRLFLYLLTLVPQAADADEILQETNLVIWHKAAQFQPGTNFLAWAHQIAYFEVLKYRERKRRDRLQFSEEFLQVVADEMEQQSEGLEQRRQALTECLKKLRDADQELIRLRYSPDADGQSVATALGRPLNSIYQSLGRIRRTLWECINRRLTVEGRA